MKRRILCEKLASIVLLTMLLSSTGCSSPQEKPNQAKTAQSQPLQQPQVYPPSGTLVNQRPETCPRGLIRNLRGTCCCPGDLVCLDRGKPRTRLLCGGDTMPSCDSIPAKDPHAETACTNTTNKPCSLPSEAVVRTLNEHNKVLHACYNANDDQGFIFVDGCIDSEGKPLHSSVRTGLNRDAAQSRALVQCIHESLGTLDFPKSQLGSAALELRLGRKDGKVIVTSKNLLWK